MKAHQLDNIVDETYANTQYDKNTARSSWFYHTDFGNFWHRYELAIVLWMVQSCAGSTTMPRGKEILREEFLSRVNRGRWAHSVYRI
jgi:hypothetical protein